MKNWKTSIFSTLAAAGIFLQTAGVVGKDTNTGRVTSALTAVSVAVTGWSAKDADKEKPAK